MLGFRVEYLPKNMPGHIEERREYLPNIKISLLFEENTK